jgi:prolyl-tRNA editing enzyme YbaK/EbsC (Cys-tRNA(Pro) deacylase)
MPIFVQCTVLDLGHIFVNGGRRGFLVELSPAVLAGALGAVAVNCALES